MANTARKDGATNNKKRDKIQLKVLEPGLIGWNSFGPSIAIPISSFEERGEDVATTAEMRAKSTNWRVGGIVDGVN